MKMKRGRSGELGREKVERRRAKRKKRDRGRRMAVEERGLKND